MQEVQEVVSNWERYQTGIVGAVGFVLVIITLVVNGRLAKRERIAALDDEREAMRVALLEELRVNLKELEKHDKVQQWIPTSSVSSVYQAFIPRIGLMEEHVKALMDTYLGLQEFYRNASLLSHTEVEANLNRMKVQEGMFNDLKKLASDAEGKVSKTINALETYQPGNEHSRKVRWSYSDSAQD